MEILFWLIVIFITEFLQSYFADRRTVVLVSRKKWKAVSYDIVAEGLGWLAIALIVINRLYVPYIISAVLGNALGTYLVAGRKLKKKSIYRKKSPFTNA